MTKSKRTGENGKITFRVWHPYSAKIRERARAAQMTDGAYARVVTMFASDIGLLELNDRISRVEDQLIRLRKDLTDVSQDG